MTSDDDNGAENGSRAWDENARLPTGSDAGYAFFFRVFNEVVKALRRVSSRGKRT